MADLGDPFPSRVQSDISILFVSGSIDGRTPKLHADEIAAGFPNHRHLVIELGGYNDLATDLRIADAVARWVTGAGGIADVARLAPITFRVF